VLAKLRAEGEGGANRPQEYLSNTSIQVVDRWNCVDGSEVEGRCALSERRERGGSFVFLDFRFKKKKDGVRIWGRGKREGRYEPSPN
jgi:hypothetical protein